MSTALTRLWPLWLSLGLVLMAGGLAVARALGEGPLHLQTGGQVRTVYVATLVYAYGALPATAIALGASILSGVAWLRAQTNHTAARAAGARSCSAAPIRVSASSSPARVRGLPMHSRTPGGWFGPTAN